MLNFLYQNKIGKTIRTLLTKQFVSKLLGWAADRSFSRHFISSFIKTHKINMIEFIIPEGGYKSFNEFFYRKLKPGTRTINFAEGIVTSPADCNVFAIQELSEDSTFFVKNCKFNIYRFLQDQALAETYKNGTLLLFRLAPQDYHRFHFPFDCVPSQIKIIHGKLESVNPIVYKSGIQPLTENERHLISLNSHIFETVLFVPVGAMVVGKIVETFTPNLFYIKGTETGYFAFGGSSIVMLFKKDIITVADEILQNSEKSLETSIKMGEFVAQKYNLSN